MKDYRFLAKLYGVRGSYPIASAEGTKIGGNTTCMAIRTRDHVVIFDAGSGIINLGKELIPDIINHSKRSKKPFHITILFTHTHIDHLIGFPYFAPAYMPFVQLNMIGPATMGVEFEDIMRTFLEPQYFPVSMDELRSMKLFDNLDENTVVAFKPKDSMPYFLHVTEDVPEDAEMIISNMKYYFHPKDGSYNFKVDWNGHTLVFATDVEQYVGSDQRLLKFAEGSDVLIHDAQYNLEQYLKFQGYGHSNYEMACQLALKAKVKKLLLFHHDPNNTDKDLKEIEKEARAVFQDTELAYEGWEWKF